MNARLFRSKAKGQSLPLIALMIVVLIAMVGLAVDVGNTYAEQRNTQRATNAAALSAMNNLIAGGDDTSVYKVIVNSLRSNNITVASGLQAQPGERLLKANYLDENGNALQSCPNIGSNCPSSALQGVKYIRVNVGGKVETYFARVVGRPDLPVDANAWAARGVCLGIYPIGIKDGLLGPNGFVNPDSGTGGVYNDTVYRNKTAKTLTIHDPATSANGHFAWLRWSQNAQDGDRGGTSAAAVKMFTGSGNIADSFNEAPWSSNNLNLPQPTGYPLVPGQLTSGDWVYSARQVTNDSNLRAKLDIHANANNRTVLILPIWDTSAGSGDGTTYHVSRLGAFALLSYSLNNQIKVAYLGNAPECSTLRQPPDGPPKVDIIGQVKYQPRFFKVPESKAVQFEIILDVSGSMSWSYEGWGWRSNTKYICTGANSGCSGSAYAWKNESERRIYFAKNAIKSFIDKMAPQDTMKLVTFTDDLGDGPFSETTALNELTKVYPTGDSTWGAGTNTTTKNTLKGYVDQAGASPNPSDKYKTDGRTPSVVGLARGIQVFDRGPTKPVGGTENYKRVVIFITDGVANIKRNGQQQSYSGSCGSEIASCNIGTGKPITQAIDEANKLKTRAQVYVIAMAGVDDTGLPGMASAPNAPFYSTSENGGDLEGILASISQDVKAGNCVPDGGTGFVPTIKEEELGSIPPPAQPLSWPTVGYATLKTENGATLPNGTAPINVDEETGLLIYRFNDVATANYQLEAWVGVKGKDNVSRVYKVIYNPETGKNDSALSIFVDPSVALNSVITADTLHLDMMGSVCPTPA